MHRSTGLVIMVECSPSVDAHSFEAQSEPSGILLRVKECCHLHIIRVHDCKIVIDMLGANVIQHSIFLIQHSDCGSTGQSVDTTKYATVN